MYNYNTVIMPKYTRRNTRRRLGKRWYANASANLPFIGKTSVAFGSGMQKRSLLSVVRNGLEDPLHKIIREAPAGGLLQNTVYSLNLTGNIPRGDTDGSRTADTIHLDAIKFSLQLTNSGSTNVNNFKHYRFMIVKSDEDHLSGSDSWSNSALGLTALFHPGANLLISKTNAKASTILYDKTVTIAPKVSGAIVSSLITDTVRVGQKYVYKTGTNYGKHSNFYMVVIGYEPSATTGTTNVGTAEVSVDMIFKDSK